MMSNIPETPKKKTEEMLHGKLLRDDYHWLEDVKKPAVQKWIDQQNEYTDEQLHTHADVELWQRRIEDFVRRDRHGSPVHRDNKEFFQYRGKKDDLPKLIVKEGDKEKVLLDVADLSKDGSVNLGSWSISNDGRLLAYSYAKGGNEINSLYIRDIDTGKDIADKIEHIGGGIRWLDDDSGFFYIRMPLRGEVDDNELRLHSKVHIHILGEPTESDKRIFGDDRPKDDMLGLYRAFGSRYLVIYATQEWTKNDIFLYDIESGETKPFIVGKNAQFHAYSLPEGIVMSTNYNAPNNQLLFIPNSDFDSPLDKKHIIIPETSNILSWFDVSKSRIIAGFTKDATEITEIYDYSGEKYGTLPTPEISTITLQSTVRSDDIYYGFVTPENPGVIYKFNVVTRKRELYFQTKAPHNPDDYETKREWTISKDGTKLPLFITKRKDIKTPAPAILYGYGGFGVSVGPANYMAGYLSWLEAGGIFVSGVIRGGSEYGEEWHKAGIKEKKQNSFDDFIAIAEYLVKKGHTSKEQLSVLGGSNGGLLVGAVMAQRPDLLKAVVCEVPLLDMVHFHKLLIAGRWVHEYGDPEKKNEFNSLIKWSPYHNIDISKRYPSLLLTTAENDTRVHPMHALKMAALMQNVTEANTTLLRVKKDTGHTAANPVNKQIASLAQKVSFLGWQLKLKPKKQKD